MTKKTIRIQGMTCNHCVMAVRKQLAQVQGVEVEDVQIGSATVMLEEDAETAASIDNAVRVAGFVVVVDA